MGVTPLVVVADDDRGARHVIKSALQQSGFGIIEAKNGREALSAFDTYHPDLLILDVIMPEMDGFEACRRIRSRPDGIDVPIMIITGLDDFEAIDQSFDAGATDFFSKPIKKRVLSERVRYMLRASATAQELRQSKELLSRAQSAARLGGFFYESGSSRLTVSEEFCKIFDFSEPDKKIGWDAFWQNIHPEDQKILEPLVGKAQIAGISFSQDVRIIGSVAARRYVMLQMDPETDSAGNVVGLIGIAQDITERKLAELLEKDQNNVMIRIARKEPLKDIFIETARLLERQRPQCLAAVCHVKNDRIQEMLSPSLPDQFCQSMNGTILSTEDGTCAAAAYLGQPVTAIDVATSPFWKNRREEALVHGLCSSASAPIFSGTGQILGTVAMMHREAYHATNADIELMERIAYMVALAVEQDHLSQQLIYQAQHDQLTGLVNRGGLIHWISQMLKKVARKPALGAYMLIDLDRFKRVNDFLGHHVGDLMLQKVAKRLQQCVRESDLLSRVGGDEFVLVLPEIRDEKDAVHAASRVLTALEAPFTVEGHELSVEASIGIALFPRDAIEGTELHKNADIAMYVAKNRGGNRFHFYDSKMHETMIQRLQVENDLRKALERQEFELHYQPQLDLASNELIVMEALVRWNHPSHGRIPPAQFIPVAEESRLIIPLGRWVLREACRQNKEWQDEGFPPVRVAVNVSAIQFTETDFAGVIQETLKETGLDPQWLEVEITESVVLNNFERACEHLQTLKDLGIKATLDDFGSGYSSITYLNRMHLDGIKIDQSFIRDIDISPKMEAARNTNFVRAFATLAQNLHLNLVAEGVETREQSRFLKKLGYTIGQGFLFSAPIPADKVKYFLKRPISGGNT